MIKVTNWKESQSKQQESGLNKCLNIISFPKLLFKTTTVLWMRKIIYPIYRGVTKCQWLGIALSFYEHDSWLQQKLHVQKLPFWPMPGSLLVNLPLEEGS